MTNTVVEAYRMDGYDNFDDIKLLWNRSVVEAYRLDGYDNAPGRLLESLHSML